MITNKKQSDLQAEFGKEHPEYTINQWISAIVNEKILNGYWDYVWEKIQANKKVALKQESYSKFELQKYQHALAIRASEIRGFTVEDVKAYMAEDKKHTLKSAAKKFGRSSSRLSIMLRTDKYRQERLAKAPPIPKDVLNMQVKDFVKAQNFFCRASNCLLNSIPWENKDFKIIDFVKVGMLRTPNAGKKTKVEIEAVLALHGILVKEIAPGVW